MLYFDTTGTGPDDKARLDWMRKQFDKLNLQLVIRATDYNRFQEKMLKGTAQIFQWGWNADYPGPGELSVSALRHEHQGRSRRRERRQLSTIAEFDRLFER